MKSVYRMLDPRGLATLDVTKVSSQEYYINRILVPTNHRCAGVGTEMMNELCAQADKEHIIIFVHPTRNYGSDLKRLTNFFERFGFRSLADGIMKRYPRS